jgi:hypothetical protein
VLHELHAKHGSEFHHFLLLIQGILRISWWAFIYWWIFCCAFIHFCFEDSFVSIIEFSFFPIFLSLSFADYVGIVEYRDENLCGRD